MAEEYYGVERRQNVRWNQIIPTRFSLVDGERDRVVKEMQSASMHNISATGVCIELAQLDESLKDEMVSGKVKMLLEISLEGFVKPALALARVIWVSRLWKEKSASSEGGYLIGLNFTDITAISRDAITEYILESYAGRFRKC